ncbi:MAG: 2-dehydropantoate 2-reductase [Verrucomicrobiae bacterium]|nr:2-dehydropantoate 2-reductase [Verrucomicrobiae bacterium]
MRIAILGAGAVGGYYGGRLVEAGADVTFLVRGDRKARLDRDGLVIESPLASARLDVKSAVEAAVLPPVDIVMLAPKAYDLNSALDAVGPIVGPNTVILPLLNGIAHMDRIAARFPHAAVWGGIAHIGVTLDSDGRIHHLDAFNRIIFGPRGPAADPRAKVLQTMFAATPVQSETRVLIEQALWEKLVFLAVLAAATSLFRANIGVIRETTVGRDVIGRMLDETIAIAVADGYSPTLYELDKYRIELDRERSPSTSSMLRDIERGAPTERAHILGDLLERAVRHGIPTPKLSLADSVIQAYEKQRTTDT